MVQHTEEQVFIDAYTNYMCKIDLSNLDRTDKKMIMSSEFKQNSLTHNAPSCVGKFLDANSLHQSDEVVVKGPKKAY